MENHKPEPLKPALLSPRSQISNQNIAHFIIFASVVFGTYAFYVILIDGMEIDVFSRLIKDNSEYFQFEDKVRFITKVAFWIGFITFALISAIMISRTLLCQMNPVSQKETGLVKALNFSLKVHIITSIVFLQCLAAWTFAKADYRDRGPMYSVIIIFLLGQLEFIATQMIGVKRKPLRMLGVFGLSICLSCISAVFVKSTELIQVEWLM